MRPFTFKNVSGDQAGISQLSDDEIESVLIKPRLMIPPVAWRGA